MIEVESTAEACTICVSYPGNRTTVTMSHGDAMKLMEKIAYNYGLGAEPQDKGKDPLDEALEESAKEIEVKKDNFFWRLFDGK